MANEDVIVYLKTPLLKMSAKEAMPDNAYRIQAKLVGEKEGGVMLKVQALGNDKIWQEPPAVKQMFVPYHKIDFISYD